MVPVRVDPGMPGRALVDPGMVVVMVAQGMGPLEMPAVSRFAVRQAVPGMRFVQSVGANAPTGIAPPAGLLPVIGSTEPAAAQIALSSVIGPSSGIGPVLRVSLRIQAGRSVVPLSAVPLTVDPSIAVRAAVPLAVPPAVLPGALAPRVLGLAGRMGPGPTVAILMPPVLTAAEIAQAPGP